MQLTQWTDYSLRVLMYCVRNSQRDTPITIMEILNKHQISKSHLTKIVSFLSNAGLLSTTRGRHGGVCISKSALKVTVGDIVRMTESNFYTVECLDKKNNTCRITNNCKLKHLVHSATTDFLKRLDSLTLSEIST